VGVSPAERGILPRGLAHNVKVRFGETPQPAGETPTLPETATAQRLHLSLNRSSDAYVLTLGRLLSRTSGDPTRKRIDPGEC